MRLEQNVGTAAAAVCWPLLPPGGASPHVVSVVFNVLRCSVGAAELQEGLTFSV